MADEDDLKALLAGDKDQVGRDLRDAVFVNASCADTDFSKAHLQKAKADQTDFSGSDFRQAKLLGFRARNAIFRRIRGNATVFHSMDLAGCDFSGADLRSARFTRVDFSGANLRGANFTNSHINEGTKFEGCSVDSSTRFDGVQIFRPLARDAAFRFYKVERGVLVRLEGTGDVVPSAAEPPPLMAAVGAAAQEAIEALTKVAADSEQPFEPAGMGHNRGPAISPISFDEYEALRQTLTSLRDESQSNSASSKRLVDAVEGLRETSQKIVDWTRSRFELVEQEFFKGLGKTLSDGKTMLGLWIILSGKLDLLVTAIVQALS